MDMAIGEFLSYSMSHKPELNFVMKSLKQVLPILKQAKYSLPLIPIKLGSINIKNGLNH